MKRWESLAAKAVPGTLCHRTGCRSLGFCKSFFRKVLEDSCLSTSTIESEGFGTISLIASSSCRWLFDKTIGRRTCPHHPHSEVILFLAFSNFVAPKKTCEDGDDCECRSDRVRPRPQWTSCSAHRIAVVFFGSGEAEGLHKRHNGSADGS